MQITIEIEDHGKQPQGFCRYFVIVDILTGMTRYIARLPAFSEQDARELVESISSTYQQENEVIYRMTPKKVTA